MKVLDKILKAGDGRRLKRIQTVVEPVNALESQMQALSDAELQGKTAEFKTKMDNGASLDDIMFEAFAVMREASWRVIEKRHYDVQLMGGAALHWGSVAEMKTGEGKTLVSTLPVYLNALEGKGVHVITVNDYLASRDAEWMGEVHRWLGLEVGLVVPGQKDKAHKKAQYEADITYGTNNEFGFDYLRDNMIKDLELSTQRGHNFAIVDEIDSILIDEARTPLIISGRRRGQTELYTQFATVAKRLSKNSDYEVDEEKRIVAMTDSGISKVEEILEVDNLYDGLQMDLVHQLQAALRAKELFKRDKDYLVQGGEVKIVDEFTGRVLDGRRWSDGLHQAVEAKESVKIKDEQQTLATITLQNYFRLYDKLAGMTGTALADAAELETTYGLAVVQVPTNKPIARIDQEDLVYKSEKAKFNALIDDLEERRAKGQPILVGTASVEKSELLSSMMTKRGLNHEVLNAKAHFREADIVAQAGKPGSITVATNMAGRGVDIILGGNPEKLAEADAAAEGHDLETEEGQAYLAERFAYWEPLCEDDGQKVLDAGGLYVLGTERHESRRIDDQLRGRAGRQGDPGESRFYLSLEDDLMRIFATGAMNWVMDRALPEDVPIEAKVVSKGVERAQNTVEQKHAETRKNVLKYDEVYNQQRKVVYERRNQILQQADLSEDTQTALEDVAAFVVFNNCVDELDDTWDTEALLLELSQYWVSDITEEQILEQDSLADVEAMIVEEGRTRYEERKEAIGEELFARVEREVMLQLLDTRWRDHLTDMAQLREGIGLRALGQRDPLVEWQREGFELFSGMVSSINVEYIKYLMKVEVLGTEDPDAKAEATQEVEEVDSKPKEPEEIIETTETSSDNATTNGDAQAAQPYIKDEWAATPRNALCPCESGKKFKQCHGRPGAV